ncbi:MAG TPA: hypothetical protein EYG49_08310 [Gammaproteobacteria bacterium]|nr:hypothetical protein [Gammaproteobacteria bacterium]
MILVTGLIFMVIAIVSPMIIPVELRTGALYPSLVFGGLGAIGLIIGALGSDHAVVKLLGGI